MKIQSWAIERVIPYAKNAKKHTPEQVAKIAAAIAEFGWDQPIVVDGDGGIIKGHGRHLAAQKLGMTRVPVVVRDDLTPEQVRAARLSDNRVALGEFDVEMVQAELAELAELNFNMGAIGFDERELEFMTASLDEVNLDALVSNLDAETEAHTQKTEQALEQARSQEVPLADAFGFRSVTPELARNIRAFMANIEEELDLEGMEALSAFLSAVMEERVSQS
jgi:ParB-like chromosome segregation protein Spo0J